MRRQRATASALAVAVVLAVAAAAPRAARAQYEGMGTPPPSIPPAGAAIEAKKLSKVPKLVKFIAADYPKEAQDKGIEADVVLMLDINAKGLVDSVSVATPSQDPGLGFEEAALAAAQQFAFEPAEKDGKPIAVQLSYRYKFRLAAPPPAPVAPAPAPPPAGGEPAPPAPAAAARPPVVNFSGILRERGTRLPIAGALVTVFRDDGPTPVGFEAAADAQGKFRFFDLPAGPWKVLSEPPGYYPFRTTETIAAGEAVNVTYFVEKGAYNPFDVTVTATRPRKEVSRTVITAAEIDKVPGTGGDPLAVISNFAGVARTPVSGLLIIRGSSPEDSRIFIDGATVPFIYHFVNLRSVIPIGIVDSIEYYPGNFSPAYGRATGGIIDVQIKQLRPKKVGGYADVSLLDTGLFLEIPLGDKGGVALAARRSYIDFILNAVVPDNASVSLVAAPRYYDYHLLANYRPRPAHDLRVFIFGSDDRLELLFRNPADIDTSLSSGAFSSTTTFYRALLSYRYIPGGPFENIARASVGRDKLFFRASPFTFDVDILTAQLRDTARLRFGDTFTLSAGADLLATSSDYFIRFPPLPKEGEPPGQTFSPPLTTNIKGDVRWSPAGFVEGEWRPRPGLLVLPGLRYDYFAGVRQSALQPRLTARWELRPGVTAKGGVGLFMQDLDLDETDPNLGTPGLTAERALHYSAGVEWKPRPHLTLDLTGFWKTLDNLVSPAADPTVRYDNGGSGTVYGLEAIARHDFSNNFAGWLAYTLSRSVRRDSGATDERLFDFDQTHILTVIGTYLLPRNWQVGTRFRLVTGNPITPYRGAVFNASADRYDPIYGPVNSARNPMFHQLDFRVDKRWVYQRWMLNFYIDIQNVYNRANAEGLAPNYNFRQTQTQQGLPLLTILGVRAEF